MKERELLKKLRFAWGRCHAACKECGSCGGSGKMVGIYSDGTGEVTVKCIYCEDVREARRELSEVLKELESS